MYNCYVRSRLTVLCLGILAVIAVPIVTSESVPASELAYITDNTLYRLGETGSEEVPLPALLKSVDPRDLSVSPNGDEVAYVCDPDTHDPNEEGVGLCSATSSQTHLWGEANNLLRFPAWSSDGRALAYADVTEAGHGSIWVTDGTSQPETLCEDWCPLFRYSSVVWSPDGETVATVAETPAGDGHPARIVLFDVETHKFDFLTEGAGIQHGPVWSPDSNEIVYSSNASGTFELWRAEVSSGEAVQLTSEPGGAANPAWSPDGEQIVFVSREGTSHGLRAIGPDGGASQKVTAAGEASRPSFLLTD